MTTCENCVNCWRDDSVGATECTADLTEAELEEYYTNGQSGCPCYKEIEEQDADYIDALAASLKKFGGLPPFGV